MIVVGLLAAATGEQAYFIHNLIGAAVPYAVSRVESGSGNQGRHQDARIHEIGSLVAPCSDGTRASFLTKFSLPPDSRIFLIESNSRRVTMAQSKWKAETLLAGGWRSATSVLLSNGNHHYVVDTGMPHEAHLLVDALQQRALKPSDIDVVINTHFHIDHVLNNSLFPSSVIYATQESFDWCCALYSDLVDEQQWQKLVLKYYPELLEYDHAIEHMHQMRKFTLRWWDRNRLGSPSQHRWFESHPLPDGLDALVTSGHVPGHISVIIPEGPNTTVIAGDACLSRSEDVQVLTMIPQDREQSRRDREQVLALGQRIFPGHDVEFTNSEN